MGPEEQSDPYGVNVILGQTSSGVKWDEDRMVLRKSQIWNVNDKGFCY